MEVLSNKTWHYDGCGKNSAIFSANGRVVEFRALRAAYALIVSVYFFDMDSLSWKLAVPKYGVPLPSDGGQFSELAWKTITDDAVALAVRILDGD